MTVSLLQRSSGIPLMDPSKNAPEVGDFSDGMNAPVAINAENDKVLMDIVIPVLVDVMDVDAAIPGWGPFGTADFASVAAGNEDINAGLSVMGLDLLQAPDGAGFGRGFGPVSVGPGVKDVSVSLAMLDSLGGRFLASDANAGSGFTSTSLASVIGAPFKAALALNRSLRRLPLSASVTTTTSHAFGLANGVLMDTQTLGCLSIRSSDGEIGQHDFMVNDRSIHNDSVANTLATVHTHAREF